MDIVQLQILLVMIVRTLAEVAGWALLGRGVLALLAGKTRDSNFIYQMFVAVTAPPIRLVRAITPRFILDTHIPFVTFILLLWLWLGLGYLKHHLCVINSLAC